MKRNGHKRKFAWGLVLVFVETKRPQAFVVFTFRTHYGLNPRAHVFSNLAQRVCQCQIDKWHLFSHTQHTHCLIIAYNYVGRSL